MLFYVQVIVNVVYGGFMEKCVFHTSHCTRLSCQCSPLVVVLSLSCKCVKLTTVGTTLNCDRSLDMQAGKTFKCVSFLVWLNCKYITIMHLCLCRLFIRTVIVLKWTCTWLWKCSIRYLPVVHVLIVAIVKIQYNTLNILQVSSIKCSVRCVYVMSLAFS